MKRIFIITLLVLAMGACFAEEQPTFDALTGFDAFQERLQAGTSIVSVYYTDGFGFSTSEFTTTDAAEIDALLDALGKIEVVGKSDTFITDWYPQIVFKLDDDSYYNISFNKHWLSVGGMDNYVVTNDEPFWTLTAELVEKYSKSF